MLDPGRPHWGPFGEPAHQLIQELFGADLKLKRISAILDANIEQLYMQSHKFLSPVGPVYFERYPVGYMCVYDEPTANANNDTFWLRELIK